MLRHTWRTRFGACAVLFGVFSFHQAAVAGVTSVWVNAANGQGIDCPQDPDADPNWAYPSNDNWSQQQVFGPWPCDPNQTVLVAPSNWSTPFYPSNGNGDLNYDVVIGSPGPTHLDVSAVIDSLQVDPGGYLNILNNRRLGIAAPSTLANNGAIVINPETCCSLTALDILANVLLQGSGILNMAGAGNQAQINTAEGVLLTQAAGHTIQGRGEITAALANAGLVDANFGGGSILYLDTNNKSNSGILRAGAGSHMDINGITISQTGTGIIVADSGAVRFSNAAVVSGKLISANDGALYSQNGTNTFTDPTLNAGSNLFVNNNTVMVLLGSKFTNNGAVTVNPQTCCSNTRIDVNSNMALQGSGSISMAAAGSSAELTTAPGVVLTQTATHTIQGRGHIPAALDNAGLVIANAGSLSLDTNAKTNSGTFRADAGSQLELGGMAVTQNGGKILANGGLVRLWGDVSVLNGTLTSAGDGVFVNVAGVNTLKDVNLTAGTQFQISNNTAVSLIGSTLTNQGTIRLNPQTCCSNTRLDVNANITLKGNGVLSMEAAGNNAQVNTADGVRLAQAAGHTIQGRGEITAALDNAGIVQANAGGGQILYLDTRDKTNSNLIKAGPESLVDINSIAIAQTPTAKILADAGTVRLNSGAVIDGGTVACENGGAIINLNGENTIRDLNAPAGTRLDINNNTSLHLAGSSFLNDGVINVNPQTCCSATVLSFDAPLTLEGSGRITLNAAGGGALVRTIGGARISQAASHTIRGRGEISAALDNDGLVLADWGNETLYLDAFDKTNTGVMKAAANGYLAVNGITIQNAGGRIIADDGWVVLNDGARIVGGTLERTGGGYVVSTANVNLTDVTFAPNMLYRVNNNTTTTLAGSAITNQGTILLNPQTCCSPTALLVSQNLTLGGNGLLQMMAAGNNSQVATAAGARLTHAAGHTISGRGLISAALDNQGTINADWNNEPLGLIGEPKTNAGVMKATAGGLLDFNSTTVTQTQAGAIRADGGTVRLTGGAKIVGGTLSSTAGGRFSISGADAFENVTLTAGTLLEVNNNNALDVGGSVLTNDGTIRVNPQGCCSYTPLSFTGNVALVGQGDVHLMGGGNNARINIADGFTLTIGQEQLVHGRGEVVGAINNAGRIIADWGNETLAVNATGSGLVNVGTLGTANGGRLVINGPVNNQGNIYVGAGSVMNSGPIVQAAGTSTVDGTLILSSGSFDLAGGILVGAGAVNGTVHNLGGSVSPGAGGIGTLAVNGGYTQTGGTLTLQIGGKDAGQFDRLTGDGPAVLGGTLSLKLAGSYTPALGDTLDILAFGARTGEFAVVAGGALPGGLAFRVDYTDKGAKLVVVNDTAGPVVVSAVSRKLHGDSGELDIALPTGGPAAAGVECRAGGPGKVVLTFSEPIKAADGTLDATEVQLSAGMVLAVAAIEETLTIELAGVPDRSCLVIALSGIQDLAGNAMTADADIHIRVLRGDVNGDGLVASADITQVKARSGQTVTAANLRADVSVDGIIASADITQVKARSGNDVECR